MTTTVRLYAERRQWPVDRIEVRATRQPQSGRITHIETELIVGGTLDAEQLKRLHEVASRCPVTQTLANTVSFTHR
jgi:putative redox protein